MQLESLKVFCDVARCRSFSQAAQLNRRTQSAVSQIVRQLEDHLRVRLLDRSTRPPRLTPLGQHFYDGCRELVERYQELEASIRTARTEAEATVEVAAIYSVGLGDMGKYVERFTADNPHVRIHVDYVHPDRVYEKVLEGTADFGLVSFPRPARKWDVLPWREEVMVLACAPSLRLARRDSVRPADLDGEKFVAFDKDLTIRRHIDRFLREQGVGVEMACEFDNIENIKKAVEESAGVALLPEPTLRREVRSGGLVAVPLSGAALVRPLGVIFRRHNKLSAAARGFIDLLRHADAAVPPGGAPDRGGRSPNGRPPSKRHETHRRNGAARVSH
jgi:DNA-binding transcriptional LysR family regulator